MKEITKDNIKEAIELSESNRMDSRAAGSFIARVLVEDDEVTSLDCIDWAPNWVIQELRDISGKYNEDKELFQMGSHGLVDVSYIGKRLCELNNNSRRKLGSDTVLIRKP